MIALGSQAWWSLSAFSNNILPPFLYPVVTSCWYGTKMFEIFLSYYFLEGKKQVLVCWILPNLSVYSLYSLLHTGSWIFKFVPGRRWGRAPTLVSEHWPFTSPPLLTSCLIKNACSSYLASLNWFLATFFLLYPLKEFWKMFTFLVWHLDFFHRFNSCKRCNHLCILYYIL